MRAQPQPQKADFDSADERDAGEYCCGVCDVKCGTDNKLRIECATLFHNFCVHIDDKKMYFCVVSVLLECVTLFLYSI